MTDFTNGLRAPVLEWLKEQAGEDWREPVDNAPSLTIYWIHCVVIVGLMGVVIQARHSDPEPFTTEKFRELLRKEKP